MTGRRHTIACLAGDGVGPELMAEASRALAQVSRLHGFGLTELHLPFGGEAVVRFGHRLPQATREGYRRADAVLAALPDEGALHAVKLDLDVCWTIARVPVGHMGDVVVVGPLGEWCEEVAVARAFEAARHRRGAVVSIGDSDRWRSLVDAEGARQPGVRVEHVPLGEALAAAGSAPSRFDVVVTDDRFHAAFTDAIAFMSGSSDLVARGWLPADGPGVFAPSTTRDSHAAGFGTVDPSSFLLAASLLLFEGLRKRFASRTLDRAVAAALARRNARPEAATRHFTDAVIELLPTSRTDTELFDEVWG